MTPAVLTHAAFVGLVIVKLLIPLALQSPLTAWLRNIERLAVTNPLLYNLYIDGHVTLFILAISS